MSLLQGYRIPRKLPFKKNRNISISTVISSSTAPRQPSSMGRGKSRSSQENEALARLWLASSEDPVVGTNQTSRTFFETHYSRFFKKGPLSGNFEAESMAIALHVAVNNTLKYFPLMFRSSQCLFVPSELLIQPESLSATYCQWLVQFIWKILVVWTITKKNSKRGSGPHLAIVMF